MKIQSTRLSTAKSPIFKPIEEPLSQRIKYEARDAFVGTRSTASRVASGAFSSAAGSLAGAVAGAGVLAGVAQVADAVIPGNAFPVKALFGPLLGLSAMGLASLAAIDGGVAAYHAEAGAHTNALSTRQAFRKSAQFHSTAAGAFLGVTATTALAQAFAPEFSFVGGLAGLAIGAMAGHKVGKTTASFGGNLATIPMKREAGLDGSPYSGKLRAEAPPIESRSRSKLTPIFDDKPFTADVMKTLSEAKESIRFETYLLNGEDGKALCDMLIKKKKEGLDVKVILDPFFQNFEAKRHKGKPEYALGQYLKDNGVSYLPYATSKLTGSLTPSEHAKILVVDNKIAYFGGTNIDDTNNQDTNVKIEGPAARDIAQLFDESWAVSSNPDESVLGLQGEPTISDPNIKVFSTGPSRSTIKQAVIDNIREAQKSIQIQMFTLTDDDLMDELKQAAERGVDVQLLLCDTKEIFHLPTFHVPNLPTALQAKKSGISVKWYVNPEFTQMHSKLMVFDGEKTMLGSMNGIHNAFRGIHEYYSEIKDKFRPGHEQQVSRGLDQSLRRGHQQSRLQGPRCRGGRLGRLDFLELWVAFASFEAESGRSLHRGHQLHAVHIDVLRNGGAPVHCLGDILRRHGFDALINRLGLFLVTRETNHGKLRFH